MHRRVLCLQIPGCRHGLPAETELHAAGIRVVVAGELALEGERSGPAIVPVHRRTEIDERGVAVRLGAEYGEAGAGQRLEAGDDAAVAVGVMRPGGAAGEVERGG